MEKRLSLACSEGGVEEVKILLQDSKIDTNLQYYYPRTPFYIACWKGQIEIVKLLLNDKRVDINKAGENNRTPFYVVCREGHIEIVKLLLNDQRVDINKATNDGYIPFFIACMKGHIEIVKLLLNDQRVDVNKAASEGDTPLFIACQEGHIEIMKLLLKDNRIDINKPNNDGWTPFLIACYQRHIEIVKLLLNDNRIDKTRTENDWASFWMACYDGHIEIVKLLLNDKRVDFNQANNEGVTPFYVACEKGHIEIVKFLLNDERVDINRTGSRYDQTPFYAACSKGYIEIVKLLLNDERVDLKKENKMSETPFYIACNNGHIEVVKLLLNNKRVDINKAKMSGDTPFHIACKNGYINIVKLLLNDQRVNTNKEDSYGYTSLYIACENGKIEIVKLLLNDKRVDINKATNIGRTPFFVACKNGHIEIVKLLLNEEKGDINESNSIGESPFWIACCNGHIEVVKLLLNDQRLDKTQTQNDRTPFFIACNNGHIEIVKLLLKDKMVDINKANVADETPFSVACEKGHIEIVKLLLNYERIEINKGNRYRGNETPFWIACYKGHTEIVKLLLNDLRVDINKPNNDKATPFYIACREGYIEIVELLLRDKRTDINEATNYRETPFLIACHNGHIEIVKLLLNDKRIDINKAENSGSTPFWVACDQGYIEIVKLLLNDERVDINKPNNDKATPFYIACLNRQIGVVKLLLSDVRTEINNPDSNGVTPFYHACQNGNIEIVKLLLNDQRVGTDKKENSVGWIDINQSNNDKATPFYIVCFQKHLEIMELLLNDQRVDLNKASKHKATPFYVACQDGQTDIVKILLNHNRVDINKDNIGHQTPFYIACREGHIEIVKLLLNDVRTEINKPNSDGVTPFYIACYYEEIKIVKYILASGREVTLNFKTNDGKSAIDVAREKGRMDIVELLESFIRNPNETRTRHLLHEGYNLFRDSIEIGKNEENIKVLKEASTFIGIKPTYFLPLNAKSQNEITHLFVNKSNTDSIPISFGSFQNLVHLDLSNNQIQEIPSSLSKLIQLQYLDMSKNKISDKSVQVLSDLIQKSKDIVLIDLKKNQITKKGANVIEESLKFNSSLFYLFLDGDNISKLQINAINEILKRKRNTLDFNTVSVYLLGYGHVGKTTLRQTIKNMDSILTSWFGLNREAESIKNDIQTECVEIDRRVNIGKTNIQIIDFGGQKEYHHGTHLFTRISRSIFLILANPFDFGFEEQVWYWLRLLNLKSLKNQNQKAEVIIIFSHKDKENDKNAIQVIETKLENLMNELRIEFDETIDVNTFWIWMDCTKTKTNEMKLFLDILEITVNKVMDKFRMNIPDISIPQKIINSLNQIFYERNELEIEIGKILKSDEIIGSHWINILLQSHDFLSIQINNENESQKEKEYICVDLEKFGKDILSQIIKPNASKYIYSSSDIIDEILSNENGKWKSIFCEILESLELCFQKGINEYLFPSMLPINSIHHAQQLWNEDQVNGRKYYGRRLQIEDKKLMFHPSFLPQLVCRLLSGIVVDEEPYIWNEGLMFKHSKEYLIGLFMHGVMESNLQESESNQTNQAILNSRKHGEPNRLKMMDILIKGPNIKECQRLMNTCLESIEYIKAHFYENLKWNQEILFPSTIQKYYSIVDKRNIFSIPLSENSNDNNGDNQFQDLIKGGISEDKLLDLYNSGDKNDSINKHLIYIAFHEGYFETIKKIIGNENQAEINNEIMFGIYLSCQNGYSNILEYTIGSGIQIDFRKTFWNKNCFEISSEEQNTEIVNIIYEFQHDPLKIKTEYRKKYEFSNEEEIEILAIFDKKKEKMKVTPPFSLYELESSIKAMFTIFDDIYIQIWDSKFEEYLDIKRVEEVKMGSKLRIKISSFWGMQVDNRWDRQGKGIKLERLCLLEENKIIDESLYNKFYDILIKFGFNLETQKLKEVFAIHNDELKRRFEAHRNILFGQQLESPKDFKSQSWKTKSDFELRSFFLDHLNDYINEFNWNDGNKPAVIPMVHGTCEKYIWQICQHGLTTLAKLDSGYYGQGVYFTRDLSYAQSYAKMTALSNKSAEYFVICCVIPGNIYPITEHPELSPNSFKGKPRIPGYQSHCTIVDKRNTAKAYPITTKKFIPEYHADELVVFQDAQILPIFAFSLS